MTPSESSLNIKQEEQAFFFFFSQKNLQELIYKALLFQTTVILLGYQPSAFTVVMGNASRKPL